MIFKFNYTSKAIKDLKKLNLDIQKRILRKLNEYSKLEDPLSKSKQLKGFKTNTYRFRIGDYRVVFRTDEKNKQVIILVILKIAHRKEIYND